jgi:glyoxalase family protein
MSNPVSTPTQGLHHVTAMVIDAQANVDFYTRTLGLDLVKATVNFDAPSVWHFYYANKAAEPGTVITHFPFADAAPGRRGTGETQAAAYAIAPDALEEWLARLDAAGVATVCEDRMGETVITFADPDGMGIELAGREGVRDRVPQRLHSATLRLRQTAPTARVLTQVLGLVPAGTEGARSRFTAPDGSHVDLLADPDGPRAQPGGGSIHHIAFRARDEDDLRAWRDRVTAAGLGVTEVKDREYFRSIYFREPGGVLFEIATDPPGFATDEDADALGTALKLPAWLEGRRTAIRARLPAVRRADGVDLP